MELTVLALNKYEEQWQKFIDGLNQVKPGIEYKLIKLDGNSPDFRFSTWMNKGLKMVDTEYVCMICDDIFPKTDNWLALLVSACKFYSAALAVPLWIADEKFRQERIDQYKGYNDYVPVNRFCSFAKTVSGGCIVCRLSQIMEIGGWDENFEYWYDDNDLSLRMEKFGNNCIVPTSIVHHIGETSMSKSFGSEIIDARKARSKAYFIAKWGKLII